MGPEPRPPAEVDVDEDLAAALVGAQHPDLVGPVRVVAEGWDNVVLRLGEDLALRLPRRALGAELVAKEVRWLPHLARHLPLPVPVPVRAGRPDPDLGYPYPWSVVRWLEGEVALAARVDDAAVAEQLVGLLAALAELDVPSDAPRNPFRGVPLAARAGAVLERLSRLGSDLDVPRLGSVWRRALTAPGASCDRWLHGDLHPGNVVVVDGRLAGVLDWGDLAVGDRACDLSVAWMLLGPDGRERLRAALAVDEAEWERARGNALAHAVAVLAHGADDPAMATMARTTLDAVLGDG